MTDAELQAIRKRCAEATPGPGVATVSTPGVLRRNAPSGVIIGGKLVALCDREEDAALFAAAGMDIAALLAALDEVRERASMAEEHAMGLLLGWLFQRIGRIVPGLTNDTIAWLRIQGTRVEDIDPALAAPRAGGEGGT